MLQTPRCELHQMRNRELYLPDRHMAKESQSSIILYEGMQEIIFIWHWLCTVASKNVGRQGIFSPVNP